MSNNSHETTPIEERFAEVFERLREQDIEQFYAHYQLWVLRRRVPLLEKEIEALREHLEDHLRTIEKLRPSPIALAVLARLQSNGVSNIDLLDTMLDRGEDWLDKMMQRLDYCEQVEDFIQGDYTQWCINSLEGAYDWIDTLLGSIKEVKTYREPAGTGVEATEELLLQRLSQDDEEAAQGATDKQPALPAGSTPEDMAESSTEETTEPREMADWENLEDVDLETAEGRSAPWYSVDLEANAPFSTGQPDPMDDWIKVLQEDTAARLAASNAQSAANNEAESATSSGHPQVEEAPQAGPMPNGPTETAIVEAAELSPLETENEQAASQQLTEDQIATETQGEQETISPAEENEIQQNEQPASEEVPVESEPASESEQTKEVALPETGTVEATDAVKTGEEEGELPGSESMPAVEEHEQAENAREIVSPQPIAAKTVPEEMHVREESQPVLPEPEQPEAAQVDIEESQAQVISPAETEETQTSASEEIPEQQGPAEKAALAEPASEETPVPQEPAQETAPGADEPELAGSETPQTLVDETPALEMLESPASEEKAAPGETELTVASEPQENVQETLSSEVEAEKTSEAPEDEQAQPAGIEEQGNRAEETEHLSDDEGEQRAWYEYLDLEEPLDGPAQPSGESEERVESEKATAADNPVAAAEDTPEIHEYTPPATPVLTAANHQGNEPGQESAEIEGWQTWTAGTDDDKTLPMPLKEIQKARQAQSGSVSKSADSMQEVVAGVNEDVTIAPADIAVEHEKASNFAIDAEPTRTISDSEVRAASTDVQGGSGVSEAPEASASPEILVRKLDEPISQAPNRPEMASATPGAADIEEYPTVIMPRQANTIETALTETSVERNQANTRVEATPPPTARPAQQAPELAPRRGFWQRLVGWFRRGR